MLLNNLYYLSNPAQFERVVSPFDRPDLADIDPFVYPQGDIYKLGPIGYATFTNYRMENACNYNATAIGDITVEFEDFDTDKEEIQIDAHNPSIGYLTRNGAENKFQFHGAFWDRWWWEDTIYFDLRDPDNNTFRVELPISYPGVVRQAPEMGHLLKGWEIKVEAYGEVMGYEVPLWGTVEWEFYVFTADYNCTPPKEATWSVANMEGAVAQKLDRYTLKVVTGWTLLDLPGSGTITLNALSDAGGPVQVYELPVFW